MKRKNYKTRVTDSFLDDWELIQQKGLVDPSDWGLFTDQFNKEMDNLDKNWETESRALQYPPLSTYGYRKRYMHSIPVPVKEKRNWKSKKSDFRIIFKVKEEEKEIVFVGIGKRIKVIPKDPLDVYSLMKGRTLPEEEEDE